MTVDLHVRINKEESVLKKVLGIITSFVFWGTMLFFWYANYNYLGGSWVIDMTVAFSMFISLIIYAIRIMYKQKMYTIDEAIEHLNHMKSK